MTARLFLAASSHSGNKSGQELLTGILAGFAKGFPACFLGAFHDDDPKWSKRTTDFLTKLGAKVSAPRLSDPDLDVAVAEAAIRGAEFLYLDGGDTVAGIAHVTARGLGAALGAAAKHAKVIFGLSGGACAAGPFTIGYDDEDAAYVAPCLGLGAPAPLDVHDETEWPEMRALLELVAKQRGPMREGIVIPTNAVLVVEPDGTLRSHGKLACERRSLAKDGTWRVAPVG